MHEINQINQQSSSGKTSQSNTGWTPLTLLRNYGLEKTIQTHSGTTQKSDDVWVLLCHKMAGLLTEKDKRIYKLDQKMGQTKQMWRQEIKEWQRQCQRCDKQRVTEIEQMRQVMNDRDKTQQETLGDIRENAKKRDKEVYDRVEGEYQKILAQKD